MSYVGLYVGLYAILIHKLAESFWPTKETSRVHAACSGARPGARGAVGVHPGRYGVPGEPPKLRSTTTLRDAWCALSTFHGLGAWHAPRRSLGLDAWQPPNRVAFDH